MHRRIALATVACALALPAGALAAEPAATGAGSVGLKPASGLKVTSLMASKSGRTVTAKVRWDRALIVRKAERERFTVRLLSGPAGQRRVLGTVSRRAPKGTSENVRFRLNARNARRVKSSSRVFATATQQFDSPDTDRLYELNHVSIASMKGKRPFASAAASSCPTEIKPNTDMTGCQLPGANLAGADLSGVKFNQANLEASNLASAWLETTDLTQADLTGASLIGAKMNPSEQSALTFPDDGGQIGKLIDSAQTSVDVVIYDFGGPNLVGQASNPGALMRAVSRGVNVRVILNSGNHGCTGMDSASQKICAGSPPLDPLYATEASLKAAAQDALKKGDTPGKYRVQFSSQNYQITHQKSILIDTSDKFGNPLTAEQMSPNSKIIVSTGNLQSFPVDWGQYWGCLKYDSTANKCVTYGVLNANYLENPAGTCKGGTPSGCLAEWGARDFAIVVNSTRKDLLERIAAVYGADQSCKDWNSAKVYQDLLASDMPDTWANGTLLANGGGYPTMGAIEPSFYGGGPNPYLQKDPQGNSRKRQLDLINSANESLIVYNEEMADPDIVNALVAAVGRKVSVRVVMASGFKNGKPTPKGEGAYPYTYYFSYLVANGVKVRLLPADQAGVNYIHAKAIVADGVNAFMGSENFGYESMNYNRELGLMLSNSADPKVWNAPSVVSVGGVAAIMTAFQQDWFNPAGVYWAALSPADQNKPYKDFSKPPYPAIPAGKGSYGYNVLCLSDPGGDLYKLPLPDRQSPQTGPSN